MHDDQTINVVHQSGPKAALMSIVVYCKGSRPDFRNSTKESQNSIDVSFVPTCAR